MKPKIALVVMVRNEEKTLPRLFASVRGFTDKIIVLDTGSTDGTVSLLRDMALAGNLEYESRNFEDFGRSRTRLMEFARGKADWLLLLDADMTLRVDNATLPPLDPAVRAYALMHSGNNRYSVARLVSGLDHWKFVGRTHEYLDRSAGAPVLTGVVVEHHADGGCHVGKFERDERLLRQDIKDDPSNTRAVFYLANTCRDMGRLLEARGLYLKRVAMGGWCEEVFISRLEAAKISFDTLELWECWASRPTRAEPLYLLEQLYRCRGEMVLANYTDTLRAKLPVPDDILFVNLASYAPHIATQFAPWRTIPGWWGDSEEEFYKRLVALIPDNGWFTEVGTWVGRSFACFDYHVKKQGKRIHKVAVDTFRGTQTEPTEAAAAQQHKDGFRQEFDFNMTRCGVSDYEVAAGDSIDVAYSYPPCVFDAVFLDGDHSFEAVSADLVGWLPKIKRGGFIAGHDYDRPSVQRAVRQFFPHTKVYGRCWIAQVV